MWLVFAILLIVWVLSIHYYAPFLVILALLAALLTVAGIALMPMEKIAEQ